MSKKYSYKDYINNKKIIHDENSDDKIDNNENDMDKIVNNIFLGNYRAAYNYDELNNNNIQYIINITDKIECPFEDKTYLLIPIRDKYSCSDKSKDYIISNLIKCFTFIDNALAENKGVLIHCKKGHHRSGNIILFYLIYRYHLSYIESLLFIKHIRPGALNRKTCVNKWGMILYAYMVTHNWFNNE